MEAVDGDTFGQFFLRYYFFKKITTKNIFLDLELFFAVLRLKKIKTEYFS